MSPRMNAIRLRVVLLAVMFLILAAIIGGFVFVQQNLHSYATEISKLQADAQSGDQNIQTLRGLEATLTEKQSAIEAAHALVADGSTYADAAINDITRIATQSGVSISSFEFVESAATPVATTTAPPATPTQTPPTAGTVSGVTKKTISVEVASPVKYSSLINFIEGIETNPLKMQIATVAMTKDKADTVGTQTFSIEVYVRQ